MRHKHYKPYKKKEYTTGEKIMYNTGKLLGHAKKAVVAGYKVASSPKTKQAFTGARQTMAEELQEPVNQQRREYLTLEEIKALKMIRERRARRYPPVVVRKPVQPFTRVTEEYNPSGMKLGWGGF